MALSDIKSIIAVTVILPENQAQIQTSRVISDGDTILSATTHYQVYDQDQRDQFVSDVEDPSKGGSAGMAAPYLAALGW